MFQDVHYCGLFTFASFLLSYSKLRKRIDIDCTEGPDLGATLERLASENSVQVSRRRRPIREQSVCSLRDRAAGCGTLRYIPRRASQLREMQHGVTFNCTCMPQHAHLYSSAIAAPRAGRTMRARASERASDRLNATD